MVCGREYAVCVNVSDCGGCGQQCGSQRHNYHQKLVSNIDTLRKMKNRIHTYIQMKLSQSTILATIEKIPSNNGRFFRVIQVLQIPNYEGYPHTMNRHIDEFLTHRSRP